MDTTSQTIIKPITVNCHTSKTLGIIINNFNQPYLDLIPKQLQPVAKLLFTLNFSISKIDYQNTYQLSIKKDSFSTKKCTIKAFQCFSSLPNCKIQLPNITQQPDTLILSWDASTSKQVADCQKLYQSLQAYQKALI